MISCGRSSERLDTPSSGAPPWRRTVLPSPGPLCSQSRSRGSILHPGSSIDTPWVACAYQVSVAEPTPRPPVSVVRPGLLQACPAWRVPRCPVGVLCIPSKHCQPLGGHSVPDVAVHVHGGGVQPDRESPPSLSCLRPSTLGSRHPPVEPEQTHNPDQTTEYRYPYVGGRCVYVN